MLRLIKMLLCLALVAMMLAACEREQAPIQPQYFSAPKTQAKPTYVFAVHPLHNPKLLQRAYQPLINYLDMNIPEVQFELEASRDYQAYEAKFRAREPEFLLPNPWQTLQAIKTGYRVIAEAGNAEDFRGIFIVRKDSSISRVEDVKGKTVSYPSPTALAACIMPQYFLHQNGIDVNHGINNTYVGSQESSIMNAYLGKSDIAATWPPPWRLFQQDHPEEAEQLKVIWQTPSLINNSVMARDDIPSPVVDKVRALLLELHAAPDGVAILAGMQTARFNPATDETYAVARDYIVRFEKEVRRIEEK